MKQETGRKKIMLIDGHSIINRAFYGVPLLSNSEGTYTNAVYGFLNILFKLIEEEQPEYIGVAFDVKAPTFRHKEYEEYKGTRKGMPDELRPQVPVLKEVLEAMGIKRFELEGYEADDVLGTLSKKAEKEGLNPIIISGDRDLLQLASDKIKIRIPKTRKGTTEIEDYFAVDVQDKYGVTPLEYIDVKGLMGDPSDNIPGVPGIGEKTAIKIIQEYHSIENAIDHVQEIKPKRASENLITYAEQARLSKYLATICIDCPIDLQIDELIAADLLNPKAYDILKKLEFKSILEKFRVHEELPINSVEDSSIYTIIDTKDQLDELLKELKSKTEFAYILFTEKNRLLGISISYGDKQGIWLPISDQIDDSYFREKFKPLFESENIKKISHQAKTDIHLLGKYGITLNGLGFDTMIAAYILNPTRDTYEYDDLANEFLNEIFPSEEEILGKGKNKKSIMDLSDEEQITFTARQAHIIFRSKQILEKKLKENDQENLYYNIELPLIEVLAKMEEFGFQVDTEKLKEYSHKLEKLINSLTNEIYDFAGEEFNINSPKQLGIILFEKLGLPAIKKTKTGYSTAADVLEKLAKKHPIVEKILEYRQFVKLKSTYVDGLFAVIDKKTKKIYSTFNQTITATGRISSTEPNLQNIPIKLEMGREIRKVFIPSNDEYVLLDADYSQIELRLLAHISEDSTLINAFKENQDIHRLTASQVLKIPMEEVTSLQRSNAKAVNFGIVYGIGAFSLSQDLGISRKEAERYIEGYFEKYPKVKEYLDKTIEDAKEKGYAQTMFGRRRAIPELHSKNFVQRSFGERVAMNMPIQGSAADIIKIAMIRVYNQLKQNQLKSKLILQVHDELLIEAHKEELDVVKSILKTEMEHAANLCVPLDIDMHVGYSWYDAK